MTGQFIEDRPAGIFQMWLQPLNQEIKPFICTQEGGNCRVVSLGLFGVLFAGLQMGFYSLLYLLTPAHKTHWSNGGLQDNMKLLILSKLHGGKVDWRCYHQWHSTWLYERSYRSTSRDDVLPWITRTKIGSFVKCRPKISSRKDKRRLVVMMKVENITFKASLFTMISRKRTLLSGLWEKNHKTSKKCCHAGLKLLERTTGVERKNERNSKAIMKNKLMYSKIKKTSAVGQKKRISGKWKNR